MIQLDAHYDVVIAGGGMVGATLALSLCRQLGAKRKILLVEAAPLSAPGEPVYTPSFDARSTALSHSSEHIYRELGLWSQLDRRAAPISTIHVSDRGRFGSTVLSAAEHGWDALGYVIENAWLGHVLLDQIYRAEQITVASPATLTGAQPRTEPQLQVSTSAGPVDITTQLLVVADGAGSALRARLGMNAAKENYDQRALIANIGLAKPHGGTAFERFTETGPVALLPLVPDAGGVHRSALIWTMPTDSCDRLLSLNDDDFLRELQQRFGYRLGRFTCSGERTSYPLSLVRADEQIRSGVVVMGNAAHALHPVAGQGYNLALRDIAALCELLRLAQGEGRPLGDLAVLERYASIQQSDQQRTIAFSDRVTGVFMHKDPLLGLLRDAGLIALDLIPGLKREFVAHAAGAAGLAGARRTTARG